MLRRRELVLNLWPFGKLTIRRAIRSSTVDAFIPPSKGIGNVVNVSNRLYRVVSWVDQPHELARLKPLNRFQSTIYRIWCWLISEIRRYWRLLRQ